MENPEKAMHALLGSAGQRFEGVRIGDRHLSPHEVEQALLPHLSEERKRRIDEVISGRTYDIAPVVEGVINTGNVSAVMRTAEGLGFQPFHIIRTDVPFKHSKRTTQGAQKWLDVHAWDTTKECVGALKDNGYSVVVTALTADAVRLADIDFTRPTAIVFGNEKNGCSPEMLALADRTCILPSPGFVQSYNISVAAAMSLHTAYAQRIRELGHNGTLDEADRDRLRADFYVRSVRNARAILERWVASAGA